MNAQYNLALIYKNGNGVAQDYAEAAKLWHIAAKQGIMLAHKNLGYMFELGKGVLQDNIRAHIWYNIASTNGHKKALEWRDETAATMTSAEILKAQKMALNCMNSKYQNCGW